MKAENIHYSKLHKKKINAASKCKNAKCFICHSSKVSKIPTKKEVQENGKLESVFD